MAKWSEGRRGKGTSGQMVKWSKKTVQSADRATGANSPRTPPGPRPSKRTRTPRRMAKRVSGWSGRAGVGGGGRSPIVQRSNQPDPPPVPTGGGGGGGESSSRRGRTLRTRPAPAKPPTPHRPIRFDRSPIRPLNVRVFSPPVPRRSPHLSASFAEHRTFRGPRTETIAGLPETPFVQTERNVVRTESPFVQTDKNAGRTEPPFVRTERNVG